MSGTSTPCSRTTRLFPHMTVAENVGYGPMVRKAGDEER